MGAPPRTAHHTLGPFRTGPAASGHQLLALTCTACMPEATLAPPLTAVPFNTANICRPSTL